MNELVDLNTTFSALNSSLARYGIELPSVDLSKDDSLSFARDLEKDLLFQINASLKSYNDLISEGPVPGESEDSQTQRHLKYFLDKFGLQVSSKVFNNLTDDYLIEIYSKSHQQIYRSVNFFKLSSYDIGSLTFIPWDKLFHRSKQDMETMNKAINLLSESNIACMTPNVPVHFLTELCSNKVFGYKMLKLATVTDSITLKPMGYLTVISVKEVIEAFKIVH